MIQLQYKSHMLKGGKKTDFEKKNSPQKIKTKMFEKCCRIKIA